MPVWRQCTRSFVRPPKVLGKCELGLRLIKRPINVIGVVIRVLITWQGPSPAQLLQTVNQSAHRSAQEESFLTCIHQ